MFTHGTTTNPFIAGASVHNQRIERLWRDAFRCVLSVYHQLFYYFEERGKLDPLSERDLYCLHLVYLNKINTALKAFQEGWNNHAITTGHSMTPVQLFTSGVLLSEHGIATIDHSQRNSSELEEELDVPGVSIPRIPPPIPQDDARHLQAIVESLADQEQNCYGIEVYDTVRALVYERS